MANFSTTWFSMHYPNWIWNCANTIFKCSNIDDCLRWWQFFICWKQQSLIVLVKIMWCVKLVIRTFIATTKLQCGHIEFQNPFRIWTLVSCILWFHHSNSVGFLHHLGVEYFVRDIWKKTFGRILCLPQPFFHPHGNNNLF